MSYFVITYSRASGDLEIERFDDADRQKAIVRRFEREMETRRDREVEVVLLEAASLEDLQRTHSRYFASFRDIAERGAAAV